MENSRLKIQNVRSKREIFKWLGLKNYKGEKLKD